MARFPLVFAAAAGVLVIVAMAATAEENYIRGGGSQGGCYQQFVEQQMLRQCGNYVMNTVESGITGWTGWPMKRSGSDLEDQKRRCCEELENMGEQCMCPAIRFMMNQPGWSMVGQMTGDMMRLAQNLPTQCGLASQPCQMRAMWV